MEMSDKYLSKISYKCPKVTNLRNTFWVVKVRACNQNNLATRLTRTQR